MKNKKINLGTAVLIIFIVFMAIFIIAIRLNQPHTLPINKQKIVTEKKVIIDKSLSKLDQFLKYEKHINLEYIKKFDLKLKMISYLEGQILKDDYKIISYKTIQADPLEKSRYFRPGYEVEILDYKYEEPIAGMDSFSRCKIKKVGDSDDKSGWLSCGWITLDKERKITNTQKNSLWDLYRKKVKYPLYSKKEFYKNMHIEFNKIDKDAIENIYYVYSTPDKKEKIDELTGSPWNLILTTYNKTKNMCEIEYTNFNGNKYFNGWLDCNIIKIDY